MRTGGQQPIARIQLAVAWLTNDGFGEPTTQPEKTKHKNKNDSNMQHTKLNGTKTHPTSQYVDCPDLLGANLDTRFFANAGPISSWACRKQAHGLLPGCKKCMRNEGVRIVFQVRSTRTCTSTCTRVLEWYFVSCEWITGANTKKTKLPMPMPIC